MGLFKSANDKASVFKNEIMAAIENGDSKELENLLLAMDDLPKSLLTDALKKTVEDSQTGLVTLLLRHGAVPDMILDIVVARDDVPMAKLLMQRQCSIKWETIRKVVWDARINMYLALDDGGFDFDKSVGVNGGSDKSYVNQLGLMKSYAAKIRECQALQKELTAAKEALAEAGISFSPPGRP